MPWHSAISHLLPLETAGAPQPHVCLASTRQERMNSPIWRLLGLCCFGISCQHRKRFVFSCQWKCSDFGRPSGLPCYLPAVLPPPFHHQPRLVRGKHSVVPIPICLEVASRSWPHLTSTRGLKQWCWPAWQGPTQPTSTFSQGCSLSEVHMVPVLSMLRPWPCPQPLPEKESTWESTAPWGWVVLFLVGSAHPFSCAAGEEMRKEG